MRVMLFPCQERSFASLPALILPSFAALAAALHSGLPVFRPPSDRDGYRKIDAAFPVAFASDEGYRQYNEGAVLSNINEAFTSNRLFAVIENNSASNHASVGRR